MAAGRMGETFEAVITIKALGEVHSQLVLAPPGTNVGTPDGL